MKGAYKSYRRPPLGESDHNMIHLVPLYKSKLRRDKPVQRTVRQWISDAIDMLRGCFECTDWDIFLESSDNLDECTEVVLDYITFCEDVCVPSKDVFLFPNQKPWFDSTIRAKVRAKHAAFRAGDQALLM
jgi:hypothetical protein